MNQTTPFYVRKKFIQPLAHASVWISLPILGFLVIPPPGFPDGFAPTTKDITIAIVFMTTFHVLITGYFYFNAFYLIPKFWAQKRPLLYFLLVLAFYGLIMILPYLRVKVFESPVLAGNPYLQTIGFLMVSLLFAIVHIVSSGWRISIELQQAEKQKVKAENARLDAELSSLRYQLNPHFLFNALNSIYSLSMQQSVQVPEAVLGLSNMMRYVLEDSHQDFVPLQKEIKHLKSFIALQKLRLTDKTSVEFEVIGQVEGLQIAPLLLFTYVENAFKHGASTRLPSTISVYIQLHQNVLKLTCANTLLENHSVPKMGVGLQNTQRRLELLYPLKHSLIETTENGVYETRLTLEL